MKWMPRSLAGQLLALLLLAVVAAHLVGVVVQHRWRVDAEVHPLSFRKIETRVVAAYRVAVTHAPMSASLLEAMSLPESRFRLTGPPAAAAGPAKPQEAALAARLRQRAKLPADTPVEVRLGEVGPQEFEGGEDVPAWLLRALDAGPTWALDIHIGLGDGQWLGSRHWPAMLHQHWSRVLGFSLPVSVLPVTLIAFLFGRRIMRPLRNLAGAAERVGRGERTPALPLEGPDGVREITAAFNDMQERLGRFVEDRPDCSRTSATTSGRR